MILSNFAILMLNPMGSGSSFAWWQGSHGAVMVLA